MANVEEFILVTKSVVALMNFSVVTNSSKINKCCPRNYIDQDGSSRFRAGDWRNDAYTDMGDN